VKLKVKWEILKWSSRSFDVTSLKTTGTISKTNCTVFFKPVKRKIGVMFGNPETTTGGNALKFYASVRLDIRRSTQIRWNNVIGNRTKVKSLKQSCTAI
jgi:recombination protein RecA